MRRNMLYLVLLCALSTALPLLCGCEDTVKYLNTKPEGLAITYEKCHVAAGGSVELSGIATDADGDSLTYKWSATAGSFVPASAAGRYVAWVAPAGFGPAVVTMTVTDGFEPVSLQQTITVCELLPSSILVSRSIENAGHMYITKSGGPLLIAGSATVTIEPGVTIVVDLGGGIESYGGIVALGTATQKIRIMQNSCMGEDGLWTGLYLIEAEAEGEFRYCEISGGTAGVAAREAAHLDMEDCQVYNHGDCGLNLSLWATADIRRCSIWDNGQGVYVEDAAVAMSRSSIRYSGGDGVFLIASTGEAQTTIDSCVVANNYTNGIVIADNAMPSIHYCSIFSNGEAGAGNYAVRLSSTWTSVPIAAENNYWGLGKDTEAEIAALIYDGADNPVLNTVDFVPWLAGPPVSAAAGAAGTQWAR